MSEPILIIGASGTGKTYSLRNMDPKTTLHISVDGKRPPFKAWTKLDEANKDGSYYCPRKESIYATTRKAIKAGVDAGKTAIVIDDSQYLLANEFFRRAHEKGYEKFNDLGCDFWNLIEYCRSLADNVLVYFLHHTDVDVNGDLKVKTIGKMLDDKACIEGKFSVCLLAQKVDGQYSITSSVDNSSIIKAPPGMFEGNPMENDMAKIDEAIRTFWGM